MVGSVHREMIDLETQSIDNASTNNPESRMAPIVSNMYFDKIAF